MKFSVLLPTHNRADVLPFAIRSVLVQTETDWELLIVGDGCTDHTADVVASFNEPRIRWFDLPKAPGFGYANRNIALREAKGDLIAYFAHDDIWLPDHLELLYRCIEETGGGFACSRPLWVEPGGDILPGNFDLRDPGKCEAFIRMQDNGIPSSCVVHRREYLDRCGYWSETLLRNADLEMWARIIPVPGHPEYLHTPTCLHFRANWRRESNVTSDFIERPGLGQMFPSLNLPASQSDQEAAWHCFETDPAGWTASLRAATAKSDELAGEMERERFVPFESSSRVLLGPREFIVRAENDDPQLILPEFDTTGCEQILVRMEIVSPVTTTLQLFHATPTVPHYTEENSVRHRIYPFRNVVLFTLQAKDVAGALRLDPGTAPGDYVILSLEIRAGSQAPPLTQTAS